MDFILTITICKTNLTITVGAVLTDLFKQSSLGTGKSIAIPKIPIVHCLVDFDELSSRLQGYTDKLVPSHRDIQKILVDIGDKSSNFIGSKQWIGSTEVGFVLETLLGIAVKVLCASSGEEMSSLASSLAYHFQTQGTPVMIGN